MDYWTVRTRIDDEHRRRMETQRLTIRRRQLSESIARRRQGDQAAGQVQALSDENAELKLIVAALARLLIAKGVITRDELYRLIDETDRSDGARDGKVDGEVV